MSRPATRGSDPAITALLERSLWQGETISWEDIVGHAPAKRELAVVAEQFRRHSVAERLGLTLVKGILIMGPPGSGKTMLAKALAASVGRPVYVIPSSEVDANAITQVYLAVANEPCVIVWDEADVVVRARWARAATEDAGRSAAAFASALDGALPLSGPITIALTAEDEHTLDRQALRAGRLTTHTTLGIPDRDERLELWRRYTRGVPVVGEVDLERAADRSAGMTGADIRSIVMVALGLSLVESLDALSQPLLDEAILRRNQVHERPPRSAFDRERHAVHEAGHTLFAALLWGAGSVVSVTLAESGDNGGRTDLGEDWDESRELDRRRLGEKVRWSLAGMVAEELVYGDGGTTLGSGHDLSVATRLLLRLVGGVGADPAIGPVDINVLESGESSDHGSEAMRSLTWDVVNARAVTALAETRLFLEPHVQAIRNLADRMQAADDLTLSGRALQEVLRGLLPPPTPTMSGRDEG